MKETPAPAQELLRLLSDLVQESHLPLLDRWFAHRAAGGKIRPAGKVWEDLRLTIFLSEAFVRSFEPRGKHSQYRSWDQLRQLLKERLGAWAHYASSSPSETWVSDPCRWGMPAWLTDEWSRRKTLSGWDDALAERFLRTQLQPAKLHLRFSQGREGEIARQSWLESGGKLDLVIPGVWAAEGRVSVFETEAWKKGAVSIQDAASFEAARLVEGLPGQTIWDVCAGRGGKTSVIAEQMSGKGALWATDIAPRKLSDLRRRVVQAGWQNVRIQPWDGSTVPKFTTEVAKRGGFDSVLVDAPCSASGTWRRDPDARFRIDPSSLSGLEAKQDKLLALAWAQLRPGGVLTYVTCSWLPRENEDRVVHFERQTAPQAIRVRQQLLGLPSFDANTMFVAQWRKPG